MIALLLALGCAQSTVSQAEAVSHQSGHVGTDATTLEDCSTSCALPDPPGANQDHLSHADALAILEGWATQPIGEPTLELETLLFYFKDTREVLEERGADLLDEAHLEYLERQLSRDTVEMQMRLLDDDGVQRGFLDTGAFPLKDKQHFRFAGTGSLDTLITGGKVKRVGLAHLWSRW